MVRHENLLWLDQIERPVVRGRSGLGNATLRCNFYAGVTGSDLCTPPAAASPGSLCAALLKRLKIKRWGGATRQNAWYRSGTRSLSQAAEMLYTSASW